jgi:hypothetical protein
MPQDYTITAVKRAFEDADQYGNITWSVKIDGETETALLKTRPENEPEEGDVVFGHLEPTKSKKATWLKKDRKEDEGGFSPSPSSAASSQPSSNGEPSFEETKAKAEEKRAKAIHDSVIFKGAVRMWIAQPNDSLGKIAVRARALYQLCECVDIPQDNEPVLSEEPPF